MVADLRQLEEKIGADHDLAVLKQSLLKTAEAFGGAEAVEHVVAYWDKKSKKLRREVEPLGKVIFDQRRVVSRLRLHCWSQCGWPSDGWFVEDPAKKQAMYSLLL
jgi:hypothetical protein